MLNQFLESHAVQARGRGHDHVSHARHSRGGLHTPADLRGSTEPFVDPDTSVGDRARPIAFKRGLQRFGAGPISSLESSSARRVGLGQRLV